ncbi:hypothetical protein F4678DRAFT_63478 [Xylaria arbuscula]|nr:hypothetical protein F4678DRAFT_63478 [Xylaria arbuscula]
MSPVLRLVARIVEDGQQTQGLQDGTEYHHNHYRDSEDDSNGGGGLPGYAIFLIVYFSILFLVFWSSLVYYWTRERERMKGGQPFRTEHVIWKACSVASGLGVWIWLFQKRGWCGSERKPNRGAAVGPYQQIGTRRAASPAPVRVAGPPPSPSGSAFAASPHTPPPWYGVPASQNTTYAPHEQPNDMFKSPVGNPNYQGFSQHDSIPMITLSPSPSVHPNPSPSPSPSLNSSYTPPPPYISSPPPAALYGQNESKDTGYIY